MAHIPPSLLAEVSRLAAGESKGKSNAQRISTRPRPVTFSDPVFFNSNSTPTLPTKPLNPITPHTEGLHHPRVSTTTPAPANAYYHKSTANRVAHLIKRDSTIRKEDLAFVYEPVKDESDKSGINNNIKEIKSKKDQVNDGAAKPPASKNRLTVDHRYLMSQESTKNVLGESPGLKAEDLNIVTPIANIATQTAETIENVMANEQSPEDYPLLRPTTRKEVILLKQTMIGMLQNIGADDEQDYPTEMHAFLSVIQEEQKIYDAVFQEIIRQVTVNMIERGEVLAEVRNRYSAMFAKIPKHVKQLHVELVAQRKLNRRLSEELLRAKEAASEIYQELEIVRQHDLEITKHAQETQSKLVSVLTQSDNTDVIMEEFHKLYRMQRDRLEDAVCQSEQEKRVWMDAATNLALRISHDNGINDLVLLQKLEHSRLRNTNHMITIICQTNESELSAMEKKIEQWRSKIVKLSFSIVDEDKQSMEILGRLQRDMTLVLRNLDTNEPKDLIETEHALLRSFHLFDVKVLAESLMRWVEQITTVAVRFTSDKDLTFKEEINQIRKLAESWIELSLKLLRRNEKNTNGKDYAPLIEILSRNSVEVEDWLSKLDVRVSGEDGVASLVISLQNQLEDKYTTYSARDAEKPLPPSERTQLKDNLVHWIAQIDTVVSSLSDTSEKEQLKVPLHIENFVSRLLDQLNTDTDLRNEENLKLHNLMTSWVVQLLVKGSKEPPTDAWDHEFHQLHQEVISLNLNIFKDSSDIEMIADDGNELRQVIRGQCDNWIEVAKRLLVSEKRAAYKTHLLES
ncbi:Axonemal dynein light chain domain-containing protein 1 [Nowakowskiella sp. JEL0407]|nr:Axonemal dynein light chain domain-containing protein 1 [Nowakowskiella sp. JEL0407]